MKFTLVSFDSFKDLMNTLNVHQHSWFLNQRKLLCNTKTKWHWPKGTFTNFLHFVNQNSAKFNSRLTGTTISTSQTKTVNCLFQTTVFHQKLHTYSDNFNKIQNQYIYVNCFWSLNIFLFNLSLLIFSPLLTWRSNAKLFGIFNCWHLFIHSSFVSSFVAYWFNVLIHLCTYLCKKYYTIIIL